jgi:hypothetical protein
VPDLNGIPPAAGGGSSVPRDGGGSISEKRLGRRRPAPPTPQTDMETISPEQPMLKRTSGPTSERTVTPGGPATLSP